MKTDHQLQQDVLDELKWDPILTSSEIGVNAKNGVVTLTGHVNTFAKKLAAESAAKRVKGVSAVAEEIEVRIDGDGRRSDTQIAEAAISALKWDSNVPDSQIQLKVEKGWITLEGAADWQYQKDAARDAVKNLTGVKGVTNLISLTPKINTREVEINIRRALHRSADIEANNIDVVAQGNKVILKGKARSWKERNEVERAVWSAPGVMEVEDDLILA